ncbi:metallophosphoesterase family protein [Sphingomonas sp.]|uniref:metallophosphoesterase family protein n=1 Tax=Sphingomonas sp. TaxID=28214 RepID=UPI003B002B1F
MRRIAHISDLHFGAEDPTVVAALRETLIAERPDLVVVSGDLSQRARTEQFVAADAFLSALEMAGLHVLVVPGNHDVPMHKPLARLFWPLRRYRRIVVRERSCFFADDEVAVLGLASAHGLTVKDGRLTRLQVRSIGDRFADTPRGATRILVTHHPLVPLPDAGREELEPALSGARRALKAVRRADVHLVLAGHHHAHGVLFAGPALSIDPAVMVVQAGTATSWRRRGLPNSFNLIEVTARNRVTVAEWTSDGAGFAAARVSAYARDAGGGWRATPAP